MSDVDAARAALARFRSSGPTRGVAKPKRQGRGELIGAGDAVRGLVDERGWTGQAAGAKVIATWPAIVGPDIAAHATAESFDPDAARLMIRADSSAWTQVLRYESATILGRIAAEIGPGIVADVVIEGPSAPSWKHGPRSVRGSRGPRDTYG